MRSLIFFFSFSPLFFSHSFAVVSVFALLLYRFCTTQSLSPTHTSLQTTSQRERTKAKAKQYIHSLQTTMSVILLRNFQQHFILFFFTIVLFFSFSSSSSSFHFLAFAWLFAFTLRSNKILKYFTLVVFVCKLLLLLLYISSLISNHTTITARFCCLL